MKRDDALTTCDQGTSITFMDVRAEDVRRHGPRDAIVLAALRKIGATSSVPVVVSASRIGDVAGLSKAAVCRALRTLKDGGAVRVTGRSIGRARALRVMDTASTVTDTAPCDHGNATRRGDVGLPTPEAGPVTRLATLRALLSVSG